MSVATDCIGHVTDDDRTTITLAATPYTYPAVRETHAHEQLGLDPARFWARVNWLIDQPHALEQMPTEVRRLIRLRAARAAGRTTEGNRHRSRP